MPRGKQLFYRLYRNPFVLFGLAPLYLFFFHYRFWRRGDKGRARWSTMRTNAALVVVVIVASLTIGFKAYIMIQLPIIDCRGLRRCLAVLCAAPVREYVLGAPRGMELRSSRAGGILILQATAHSPVVQWQYRLPSRSSPESREFRITTCRNATNPIRHVSVGETHHAADEPSVSWLSGSGMKITRGWSDSATFPSISPNWRRTTRNFGPSVAELRANRSAGCQFLSS